jgi:NAD-dependent SIR2 family protein deacetylase
MGNGAFKAPEDIPSTDRSKVFDGKTPTLAEVARLISTGAAKNIVVLCGAGISVSAGIPDFRSVDTGIYATLAKEGKLPKSGKVEDVFNLECFREDPSHFFNQARGLLSTEYQPTLCHYFFQLLNKKGVLRRIYSQNIDCLERKAGLPQEKVVLCHGSYDGAECVECDAIIDADWMRDEILADREPRCACGGLCKPPVVMFGQRLGERFKALREQDFIRVEDGRTNDEIALAAKLRKRSNKHGTLVAHGLYDKSKHEAEQEELRKVEALKEEKECTSCACDMLLVFGTSLKVQPVASLPGAVHWLCPRVLLNREAVFIEGEPLGENDMPRIGGDNGFRFERGDNYRDVLYKGDCDAACMELAGLLGWKDELQGMAGGAPAAPPVLGP